MTVINETEVRILLAQCGVEIGERPLSAVLAENHIFTIPWKTAGYVRTYVLEKNPNAHGWIQRTYEYMKKSEGNNEY